jgi:hypothetical protein
LLSKGRVEVAGIDCEADTAFVVRRSVSNVEPPSGASVGGRESDQRRPVAIG